MVEYLKYHSKLKKYNNDINSINESYATEIKKADSKEVRDALRAQLQKKEEDIVRLINAMKSKRIEALARKYDVPLPPHTDRKSWESDWHSIRLTTEGRFTVNRNIRQEIKERFEPYVMICSILTGLGGVIIGILSLW
ncbi:hypothetical protein [uncultured Desulfosarcina sp.]|uniref:hypothetical protein n=1 Tax=uncultured Desulfosarcina sp. TaxID=218289 RepID=UPI0029C76C81|nr:hypothetical protein [uncultured Desulfosarcina sp.]